MNEKEFKALYIVIFAATHTAKNYDENCMLDKHDQNLRHHIMDDAFFLADYAWEKYVAVRDSNPYRNVEEAKKFANE